MKILYLHPRSWSGEYAMLRELARRGETVCVLEEKRGLAGGARVLADHFETSGDGIATLWYDPRRGAARLFTWPFDRFFRRAFDGRRLVYRMWVIREALARFRPDVVVCSDGFSYAIPAALLKRLGFLDAPLVASYIGGDVLDRPDAELGRRRTGLVRFLLRQPIAAADALRPVSPLLAAELRALGARDERMTILPSHLTAPRELLERVLARRAMLRDAIRERHAIAPGAPLVITVSANFKTKGLQILAQAWPQIVAAIPQARWMLCGPQDPWLAQGVLPLLRSGRVEASVILVGKLAQESVYEYLAAADLNLNPSLAEGLNVVAVESAAVGTPTVTTDGAGIAAWIARLDCGQVVPSGDPQRLATAVIEALPDEARRKLWSARCPALVDEFAIEQVATKLQSLLRALVK